MGFYAIKHLRAIPCADGVPLPAPVKRNRNREKNAVPEERQEKCRTLIENGKVRGWKTVPEGGRKI